MKVLPAKKIEEALNVLAKEAEVFAPIARGQVNGYFQWLDDPDDELAFEVINTFLSPKNIVIPQTEKMYAFKTAGLDIDIKQVEEQVKERIIFGIKACDLKGLEALDMVFLTRGFVDEFYKLRREKTIIIARACYQPGEACFCESMGVNRLNPAADVIIHDIGRQDFAWEPLTEKGEGVTARLQHLLEEQEVTLPEVKPLKRQVDIEGLGEKLKGLFENQIWEELSSRCMTCGVCTNVCPTCYCFDIQAEVWGEEGYRFRCWDSCMYKEYTQMAGGHNPRENKRERFRNRFLHKLQFFEERYGTSLCTGCGRCVVMCPNFVNILEIIRKVKEVEVNG